MAGFSTPIPRAPQPKFHEGSALRSVRDSDNNSLLWKRDRVVSSNGGNQSNGLENLRRQVAQLRKRIPGGSIPNSGLLQDFQLVSDGGDYYNCYTYDGKTAGTTLTKVAKHQDIRCILPTANPKGGAWPSKTIRGITYTYTYTPTAGSTTDGVNVIEYVRGVSGDDGSAETDYITPCLNVGDIITASQTAFADPDTLTGVTWQAQADGRAWAASPA